VPGYVAKVNWPHNGTAPTALLSQLTVSLSVPFGARVLQFKPPMPIIQVWVETGGTSATPAAPQPSALLVLHGTTTFSTDNTTLTWKATDALDVLNRTAQTTGARILVRIHCWLLTDAQNVIFSAAPDAILGLATPKVPGGILESWFSLPKG
jgi:hypothetical protein